MASVSLRSSTSTDHPRSPQMQPPQAGISPALWRTHQRAVARAVALVLEGARTAGGDAAKSPARPIGSAPRGRRGSWAGPLGAVWGGVEDWLVATSSHERVSLFSVYDSRISVLCSMHKALSNSSAARSDTFFRVSEDEGRIMATRRCPADLPRSVVERNAKVELDVRACDGTAGCYRILFVPQHLVRDSKGAQEMLLRLIACAASTIPFEIDGRTDVQSILSSPDLLFSEKKWYTAASYAACIVVSSLVRAFLHHRDKEHAPKVLNGVANGSAKCPLSTYLQKMAHRSKMAPKRMLDAERAPVEALLARGDVTLEHKRKRGMHRVNTLEAVSELLSRGGGEYGHVAQRWSRLVSLYTPGPNWEMGQNKHMRVVSVFDLLYTAPLAHLNLHGSALGTVPVTRLLALDRALTAVDGGDVGDSRWNMHPLKGLVDEAPTQTRAHGKRREEHSAMLQAGEAAAKDGRDRERKAAEETGKKHGQEERNTRAVAQDGKEKKNTLSDGKPVLESRDKKSSPPKAERRKSESGDNDKLHHGISAALAGDAKAHISTESSSNAVPCPRVMVHIDPPAPNDKKKAASSSSSSSSSTPQVRSATVPQSPGAPVPYSPAGAPMSKSDPPAEMWGSSIGRNSNGNINAYFKNLHHGLGLDDEDIVDRHDDEWNITRRVAEAQRFAEMQPIGYAFNFPDEKMPAASLTLTSPPAHAVVRRKIETDRKDEASAQKSHKDEASAQKGHKDEASAERSHKDEDPAQRQQETTASSAKDAPLNGKYVDEGKRNDSLTNGKYHTEDGKHKGPLIYEKHKEDKHKKDKKHQEPLAKADVTKTDPAPASQERGKERDGKSREANKDGAATEIHVEGGKQQHGAADSSHSNPHVDEDVAMPVTLMVMNLSRESESLLHAAPETMAISTKGSHGHTHGPLDTHNTNVIPEIDAHADGKASISAGPHDAAEHASPAVQLHVLQQTTSHEDSSKPASLRARSLAAPQEADAAAAGSQQEEVVSILSNLVQEVVDMAEVSAVQQDAFDDSESSGGITSAVSSFSSASAVSVCGMGSGSTQQQPLTKEQRKMQKQQEQKKMSDRPNRARQKLLQQLEQQNRNAPMYNPLRPIHEPIEEMSSGRRAVAELLGAKMREYVSNVQPTEKDMEHRQSILEAVRGVVAAFWSSASVDMYGSFTTGVSLPTSDMDIVVTDNKAEQGERDERLKLLFSKLSEEPWASNVTLIDTASVPVIKLEAQWGGDGEDSTIGVIPVDITFSLSGWEYTALMSRDFVNAEMDRLRLVRPIVLVLKQMLYLHGLNDSGGFSGGLSSHSLCLLIISYFQNLEGGQLPMSNGDVNDVTLGEALLRVMQWLATFPFNHLGVQVFHPDPSWLDVLETSKWRLEALVPHTEHAWSLMAQCYVNAPERDPATLDCYLQCAVHYEGANTAGDDFLLIIQDTFNPDVNVAAATFMWWRVRMELEAAYNRLKTLIEATEVRKTAAETPPSSTPSVDDPPPEVPDPLVTFFYTPAVSPPLSAAAPVPSTAGTAADPLQLD